MASVDDRVVSMQFDNAAFENKVSTTISSLDKLKGSLDFANANRGMADLTAASNSFSLAGISTAVESIAGKFTAMGAVAFSVINNITTRAIDMGVQLAKSLSLDQVLSGFHEYETNLNAIQTVLANTASKGTTLNDVNAALQQLNDYSDKTIYNFADMAKNIGTFTAAGVDLGTSVNSIKGIANLAALSGSNAEQAATGMYQLSQAISQGSVKLMDWNSVQNAGMGGEVFKTRLFETAKAMGTLKNVPMDQTFQQWTDAGNSFRDSLQDGWITGKVLTTTLAGFTGDLTDAQLKSMGYNATQIKQIQDTAKSASDAATVVKSLTQLMSTVKESVGSGWTQSFQIVFGTFDEAKATFTDFYNAINKVVGASADARNALLTSWKDMGGRNILIDTIKDAFKALASVISTVKDAFDVMFPPMTGYKLFQLTEGFHSLIRALTPGTTMLMSIKTVFGGLFAAIKIGMAIVKGIVSVFTNLFDAFGSGNGQNVRLFLEGIAVAIMNLNDALVAGGGIAKFFDDISNALINFFTGLNFDNVIPRILGVFSDLKDAIVNLFKDNFDTSGIENALGRVSDRFGWVITVAHTVGDAWDWLMSKMDTVRAAFGKAADFIEEKFKDLPKKIGEWMSKGDYSQVLDTVNTGMLAGLVLLFKKLTGSFTNLTGGLVDQIKGVFGQLTSTLSAMQAQIQSKTLMKIAEAVLMLAGAMVILSLIDSASLTKALTAMAFGFGELVGTMVLMDKVMSEKMKPSKMLLLSSSLVFLAGAMILLAVAVKILSSMSWAELGKGLTAVAALLVMVSLAVKPISDNSSDMIKAGIGIMAIAVALNILALAVKSFAEMSWAEMAKGMAGVAVGLGILVAAVNLIPKKFGVSEGVGLIAVAVALNILALAVKSFAEMSWADMAKGMTGIAGALLIIAGAMYIMPNGILLTLQGAGLLMIGIGLVAIAQAVKSLSKMSWGEMAKGLTALAGVLLLLAIAVNAMDGALAGAAAMAIASVSLVLMAKALKEFASIGWIDLIKGLVGIAGVLIVLGLSAAAMSETIPAMLGLGAALVLIGGGFALFGLGASLVASAFGILASSGSEGAAVLIEALKGIIAILPEFIATLGAALIKLVGQIIEALPGLIAGLAKVLDALFQLIIDSVPKLVETVGVLLSAFLQLIIDKAPEFVAAGFALLIDFLRGIRDNIEEVTSLVIEIVVKFINTLTEHMQEIISAGANMLAQFLLGIANNMGKVISAGGDIIVKIIEGIGNLLFRVTSAAADAVVAFLKGLSENILKIVQAGWDFIISLIDGIADSIDKNMPRLRDAGLKLAGAIIDGMTFGIAGKAKSVVGGIVDMGKSVIGGIGSIFGIGSPSKVFHWIGDMLMTGLANGISDNLVKPTQTLMDGSENMVGTMSTTMSKIADAMNQDMEFNPTITPVLDLTNVQRGAGQLSDILGTNATTTAQLSYTQASGLSLATTTNPDTQTASPLTGDIKEIKFEQNNYSPEALSVGELYRQTNNQIAMAKEALQLV